MTQLSLQTNVTLEQLYALLAQLSAEEKINIAQRLRAEVGAEKWKSLSALLPDEELMPMEDIVAEVKAVRKNRHQPRLD